jgi:hypothetical protein
VTIEELQHQLIKRGREKLQLYYKPILKVE